MNPRLRLLQPYPFARLREALSGVEAASGLRPIPLHIGEPKHAAPEALTDVLQADISGISAYPATAGTPAFKQACSNWLARRYDGLHVNPETEILPVLGSREALFAFVQTVINDKEAPQPAVVSPNPFYQIYEGAALLAGARILFADCTAATAFLPDWESVGAENWPDVRLVFVCSPGNPAGAVLDLAGWAELFRLQDHYGFVIASDECYSEIYREGDTPPLGCLQAAHALGRNFDKLVMFTSLSKRSNVPGLRSGFAAGDNKLIADFLLYRTYHGSAMSLPVQAASAAAWEDEAHVVENRRAYTAKFDAVLPVLARAFSVSTPDASFYIWLKVPDGDDLAFTRKLWREAAVGVLPGRFLARDTPDGNPGEGYVRIALVAPLADCVEAAERMVALYA